MDKKSRDAFRTISEVADWLDTPTHVLRFWESRFTQVKPVKRAGGRRYYRPNDMLLIGGIKKLLHEDGMTIRGVQKLLREEGVKHVSAMSQPIDGDIDDAFDDAIDIEATVAEAPMAVDVEPQPELDNVVSLTQPGNATDVAEADDADATDDAPLDATPEELAAIAPTPAQEDLTETDDAAPDTVTPDVPPADDHVAATPVTEEVGFDDALETVPMDDGQTFEPLDDTHAEGTPVPTAEAAEPAVEEQVDMDLAPAPVGAPDATALPPRDEGDAASADTDDTADGGFDFNAPTPLLDEDDPSASPHAEAPFSPAMDDAERPAADDGAEQTDTAQDEPHGEPAPAVAQVDVPEDPDDDADLGDGETPVIAALRAGAASRVPEDALERAMDKLRTLRARM